MPPPQPHKPSAPKLQRALALVCRGCPLCRRARRNPKGAAADIVRRLEQGVCPFCRAYNRAYGRPAHT